MPDLNRLVDRARAARVADDDARAYVAELGRWARVEPEAPRRVWAWWLGGGLALAAVLLLLIVARGTGTSPRARDEVAIAPVYVGARVAMVADPETRWSVVRADADETEIVVQRGTVTARLFPGANAHRLALRGANVSAFAVGTVYSLTVGDAGGVVEVHEGTVEVLRADSPEETHRVHGGERWPATTPPRALRAAEALLALPPQPEPPIPSTIDAAPAPVVIDAAVPAPRPAPPSDARVAPARTLTDRWRRVRLLRGQGDFEGAVRESLAIADARDTTWSPIALIEAARIELGPRASPERTISLVDRFLVEWASHPLAPEARELRCRALRQLGREAECTAPP